MESSVIDDGMIVSDHFSADQRTTEQSTGSGDSSRVDYGSEPPKPVGLGFDQLDVYQSGDDAGRNALAGLPEILVTTPACIPKCFADGVLDPAAISDLLEILVLDEADLLLSYGYEDNLSSDVEKLKKLILHNLVVLTLQEGADKEEPVPSNVQQFWISCSAQDKLLHILALLKLEVVQKKILIFINTIDMVSN
uniref:ATP-dependent RNA helicase n=1 Tax=Brassica oleracea TaxID=3712 RepID=A0A3P6G0R6_BRAOL|nr:unnamed protein product [Brassica oleracea]